VSRQASSSVGREAVLILVARVLSALATVVVAVVLANALGPASFGRYRLALTASAIGVLLAGQGLAAATGRFLVAASDDLERATVLRRAFRAKAYLAFVPAVLLAALAVPIAHLVGKPDAWPLFLIAALSVPVTDVTNWIWTAFQATRQASASLAVILSKSLVELPAALVLIGVGFGAVSGVIAYTAANAAACVVGVYLLSTRWWRKGRSADGPTARAMLRFGRQVWFTDLAFLGFQTVDQVMLQAFKGSRSVGIYDVAWQLTTGLTLLSLAVSSAVAPRMADADRQFANALFAKVLCALIGLYSAIAVLTVLLGSYLVDVLFESSFDESGRILAALAPYVLLLGVAPLVSTGLNFLGIAHARRRIAINALLINAVLDLIFIHWLGTIGPTIGTGVAFGYYVLAHCLLYRRSDISIPWRGCALSFARGVFAGLVGAAIALVWLHGFSTTGALPVLAALTLGGAASAAALIALGEMDISLWRLIREREA
jgi:O-antigen/teichoic acid export membrane protein